MKSTLLPAVIIVFVFAGCSGPGKSKNDSAGKDSVKIKIDPEKPHPVKKGHGAGYAFKPDTSIQKIILGNPDCFAAYKRENGSSVITLDDKHKAVVYYNSAVGHAQLMELRTTKNRAGKEIVYAIIVQKADGGEHAPALSGSAIPSSDFNFVSGHGISLGLSEYYVMSVYSNQSFMEWEKGDTVYLEYKPKPKDFNYYRRYKPGSYRVMYKFRDDVLVRMEYSVDPEEFEK